MSNKLGYHIDVLAGGDYTSETTAVATTANYVIWEVDPADSTNHIVSIYESEVWGV